MSAVVLQHVLLAHARVGEFLITCVCVMSVACQMSVEVVLPACLSVVVVVIFFSSGFPFVLLSVPFFWRLQTFYWSIYKLHRFMYTSSPPVFKLTAATTCVEAASFCSLTNIQEVPTNPPDPITPPSHHAVVARKFRVQFFFFEFPVDGSEEDEKVVGVDEARFNKTYFPCLVWTLCSCNDCFL